MNRNRKMFWRMCAVILTAALLTQEVTITQAASQDTGASVTQAVPQDTVASDTQAAPQNTGATTGPYMSKDELKKACEAYDLDPSGQPSDNTVMEDRRAEVEEAYKTARARKDENEPEPDYEEQAKEGLMSGIASEYGTQARLMGFNASTYGLKLDLLDKGGLKNVLLRYGTHPKSRLPSSLTPVEKATTYTTSKDRSLFESLTPKDQSRVTKVTRLGADASRNQHRYENLLRQQQRAEYDQMLVRKGQLGEGFETKMPDSKELKAAKTAANASKARLNAERVKWYKTGGILLLRVFNVILGAYAMYQEAGNLRKLYDEFWKMKDDDPAASWLGRAALSTSAAVSGLVAFISGLTGAMPALEVETIGTTQLGFMGTITGIVVLVAAGIGAGWLVTTDEFQDYTSDWTWRNVKYTLVSMIQAPFTSWSHESNILMDEMIKEMEAYPWKQHMDEGFQEMYYFFDDLIYGENSERNKIKPAPGIGALKPNVYIYPESAMDVTVSFDVPQWLTKSNPDYSGSWQVSAAPDGTLTADDGSTYGYLFYESETRPYYFQKEEGWMISADTRAEQFGEILRSYGFNETEICDFLDFWTTRLPEGTDVMMYPQPGERVDLAMPMRVSPAPEHLFRLWFTFEPFEEQEVREPVIEPMERDGYTVTEWGGVILNEGLQD